MTKGIENGQFHGNHEFQANSEVQPVFPLALAIVKRNFHDMSVNQNRIRELIGMPVESTTYDVDSILIPLAAKLIDPYIQELYNSPEPQSVKVPESSNISDVKILGDSSFSEFKKSYKDNPNYDKKLSDRLDENMQIFSNDFENFMRSCQEQVNDQLIDTSTLAKQIQEAKRSSQEKNIDITEVYDSDDLFFELIRRTVKPEDYIRKKMIIVNYYLSEENIMNLHVLRVEYRAIRARTEESLGKLTKALREDKELKRFIKHLSQLSKMACWFTTREKVQKIWGDNVLESLPDDLRQKLESPTVEEIKRLSKELNL